MLATILIVVMILLETGALSLGLYGRSPVDYRGGALEP
mgnify:CR=1 FL=1